MVGQSHAVSVFYYGGMHHSSSIPTATFGCALCLPDVWVCGVWLQSVPAAWRSLRPWPSGAIRWTPMTRGTCIRLRPREVSFPFTSPMIKIITARESWLSHKAYMALQTPSVETVKLRLNCCHCGVITVHGWQTSCASDVVSTTPSRYLDLGSYIHLGDHIFSYIQKKRRGVETMQGKIKVNSWSNLNRNAGTISVHCPPSLSREC